jgi:thiamine biosynthesis lipoprotein
MGTRITVELWSEDPVAGQAAIDAVMDEMRHIDATMSVYIPTSEVSKVNAEAGAGPVKISKELFDLLRTAVEYSVITEGAFDITYASVGYRGADKKRVAVSGLSQFEVRSGGADRAIHASGHAH